MAWTGADIPDQTGRVAVVTGANGGLGLETSRALARAGASVIMAARNLEKAAAAEAEIRAEAPAASLEVRGLDLASLESIGEFARGLVADHDRIDLLFNNAGIMATLEQQTADGFELQFGVNHLGHFYLTSLLLPALLRADAGRVVNTTSTGRFYAGKYDLSNPHLRGEYDPWMAYGYSKRANLHFAIELNRRLGDAGGRATAYAADPGYANTELQATSYRSSGGWTQRVFAVGVRWFGQSPARGALPLLRAGTDPGAQGGALYRPRWVARGSPVVGRIGPRLRKREDLAILWEVSERETGITFDVAALVAEAKE